MDEVSSHVSKEAAEKYSGVEFLHIQDIYKNYVDLRIQFTVKDEVEPDTGDYVALVMLGDIKEERTVSNVYVEGPVGPEKIWSCTFSAHALPKDEEEFFQFLYVSNRSGICGISGIFSFASPWSDDRFVEEEDESGMVVVTSRVTFLQKKVTQLEENLQALKQIRYHLKMDQTSLQSQLAQRVQEKIDLEQELQQQRSASANKLAELTEALHEKDKKIEAIEEDHDDLKEKTTKQIEAYKAEIANLKQELLSMSSRMAELQEQLDKKKKEVESLEHKLVEHYTASAEERKRQEREQTELWSKASKVLCLQFETVKVDLERQLQQRSKEIEDLTEALNIGSDQHATQIAVLENNLLQKQEEAEGLAKTLYSVQLQFEKEKADLERELQQKHRKVVDLGEVLQDALSQCEKEKENAVNKLQRSCACLEDEKKIMKQEMARLQNERTGKDKKVDDLSVELATVHLHYNEEKGNLLSELKRVTHQCKLLLQDQAKRDEDALQNLKLQARMEAERKHKDAEMETLRDTLLTSEQALCGLDTVLEQKCVEVDKHCAEIESLQKAQDEHSQQLAKRDDELGDLRAGLDLLLSRLEKELVDKVEDEAEDEEEPVVDSVAEASASTVEEERMQSTIKMCLSFPNLTFPMRIQRLHNLLEKLIKEKSRMKKQMDKMNKAYADTFKVVIKERDDVVKQKDCLARERDDAVREKDKVVQERDWYQGRYHSLKNEVDSYKNSVIESQTRETQAKKDMYSLQTVFEQTKNCSDAMSAAKQQLEARVHEQEAALEEVKRALDTVRSELVNTTDMFGASQTMNIRLSEELRAFEQTQASINDKLISMESQLRDEQASKRMLLEETESWERRIKAVAVHMLNQMQGLHDQIGAVNKLRQDGAGLEDAAVALLRMQQEVVALWPEMEMFLSNLCIANYPAGVQAAEQQETAVCGSRLSREVTEDEGQTPYEAENRRQAVAKTEKEAEERIRKENEKLHRVDKTLGNSCYQARDGLSSRLQEAPRGQVLPGFRGAADQLQTKNDELLPCDTPQSDQERQRPQKKYEETQKEMKDLKLRLVLAGDAYCRLEKKHMQSKKKLQKYKTMLANHVGRMTSRPSSIPPQACQSERPAWGTSTDRAFHAESDERCNNGLLGDPGQPQPRFQRNCANPAPEGPMTVWCTVPRPLDHQVLQTSSDD